jgi:dCMP deaminase
VHAEQNALLTAARFGIAVRDATIYSTMQPCFGCGKELLQAKVKRIVFLHPWTPSDVDPEMDSQKKAEYEKLLAGLATKKLSIKDPRAEWAVTALRKKT